ncbi:MAG TPA: TRAP transporter small permease [Rhizobiales bacterium]|nr:TRAP transporter small permease [Hyphomicrobiales bacterium]
MRRLLDGLYQASLIASACFIVAICAVVIGQVMLNLIDRLASIFFGGAIGLTIPSYADFTGFFLAAASFLALAGTLRDGGHIRVSLLTGALPEKIRKIFELWCVLLALLITTYACWYMYDLVHESWKYSDLSPGMIAVPLWIPQLSLTAGLSVLAIALLDEFICLLGGAKASWHGKGENLLDGNEG